MWLWLFAALLVMLAVAVGAISLFLTTGAPEKNIDSANSANSGRVWRMLTLPGRPPVRIAARPERIVAANSGAADILAALIDPKRFAAVPVYVDQYAASRDFWKAHPEIPRFEHYQAEPILAAHPDLVVSSALQDANTTAWLEREKIPVLNFENFETFAGIRAAILKLGVAVGEEKRAVDLAGDFDRRLKEIEEMLGDTKRLRVLYYSNYGSGGFTVGSGGSQDEILLRAGGLNAAAELGIKGASSITFEQMLRLDPDVLVVCGEEGRESTQAKLLMGEPALAGLPAIKTGRIAAIPPRLFDALSQQVVDAVEILSRQLYPNLRNPSPLGGEGRASDSETGVRDRR
jgi:iron complex transport system substrate-binding protein